MKRSGREDDFVKADSERITNEVRESQAAWCQGSLQMFFSRRKCLTVSNAAGQLSKTRTEDSLLA